MGTTMMVKCSMLLSLIFCTFCLRSMFDTFDVIQNDFEWNHPAEDWDHRRIRDSQKGNQIYKASHIERYFLEHGDELGYNRSKPLPPGCKEWQRKTSPMRESLQSFREELKVYEQLMLSFNRSDFRDLREHILETNYKVCDSLELHPNGLQGIFPSGSLSKSSNGGFMEPLVAPLRSPDFCFVPDRKERLLSLEYLVHDFAAYCRQLLPSSRIVLIDMGAALDFHKSIHFAPAMYLTTVFQQFGFRFDHIYAFEVAAKNASNVFDKVPQELMGAYHWINVGVDPRSGAKLNPWTLLEDRFTENDFVIVKIDIDTPSVEMALARQLRNNPNLTKLVDIFYFEHHVHLREMAKYWADSMKGTVISSLRFFQELRQKGVDAHYWV